MGSVRFTQAANDSLLSIGKFIANEEQDIETALAVLDKIDNSCRQFALFPLMGVARPELGEAVRCFVVFDYLVLYVADEEGIAVLDIIHSSRELWEDYRGLFS